MNGMTLERLTAITQLLSKYGPYENNVVGLAHNQIFFPGPPPSKLNDCELKEFSDLGLCFINAGDTWHFKQK